MSIDPNVSGGDNQNPGGNLDGDSEAEKDKKTVSFDSHQKLMDEKKSLAKRLADLEKRDKDREAEELKAKDNWKQLVEVREKERDGYKTELDSIKGEIASSRKLRSFLGQLNGDVDEQYWRLIDLDEVAVDPDTGKPDEASLKKAVKEFEKQYPDVIKPKGGAGKMPNDPAKPPAGKLKYEEWLKLPLDEKKKRQHEVM